jgi:hypothetical protein
MPWSWIRVLPLAATAVVISVAVVVMRRSSRPPGLVGSLLLRRS